MAGMAPVEHFLFGLCLKDYKAQIAEYDKVQRLGHPPPLTNDILPMFLNRWVAGPSQCTKNLLPKLTPAFQLVSLLLTEHFPLLWYNHFTFGERRGDARGTYIVTNEYSSTTSATQQIKANLQELGKVVTFMFGTYPGEFSLCGAAYDCRPTDLPELRQLSHTDWPPTLSYSTRCQPVIVLNAKFLRFFEEDGNTDHRLSQALFTFAITLGHEIAHAYGYWLGLDRDEPRWIEEDLISELGESWERQIFGTVLTDLFFRHSYSFTSHEFITDVTRDRLMNDATGSNGSFTKRDVAGMDRDWPRKAMRGSTCLAIMKIVPLQWIKDWFREDVMAARKCEWNQARRYIRPRLENAFTLVYEMNGHGVVIHRSLAERLAVDAEILRKRGVDAGAANSRQWGHRS